MTSKRETIMAAIEARIETATALVVRRQARGDEDAHVLPSDLPAIVMEMRRDVSKSANEQTERTLEIDIAIYSTGQSRVTDADALAAQIVPAVLARGADLPGVRIREGDTVWTFQNDAEDPVLLTSIALSVAYKTLHNSIN